MRKWRLEIWTDKCDWEYMGLFETYEKARDEGREVLRWWRIARDFAVNPVEIPDNEPDEDDAMNPKDINFNVNVNFADSMDQSCPSEIHAHGFPADDPKAKQEYEKAAKDFCIDNLGAFDK
ncbi:hypothetical protein FNC13_001248 [Escherichia coli]|nr:hypothetical protein [Escherichia coli]